MKSFAAIAAFAGAAAAQNLGQCAQLCVGNMATIAQSQFQCAQNDQGCFCTKSNWAYGIRDCSQQACGAEESAAAVSYAAGICQGFAGASSVPAALPILSSALATLPAGASSVVASVTGSLASEARSAVTTVPLLATVTNSDGSVATTTTGLSTVYGSLTESAASQASSIAASASGAVSSAVASASSAANSAASSASGAVSSLLSRASSAVGSATSAAASSVPTTGGASIEKGLPVLAGVVKARTKLPRTFAKPAHFGHISNLYVLKPCSARLLFWRNIALRRFTCQTLWEI
ncbi:hypothetical protein HBH82_018450 [Parastagonospora nodorum]|nr:hypothetical protein HBH82_018450 [Parastagonospora nodorum]